MGVYGSSVSFKRLCPERPQHCLAVAVRATSNNLVRRSRQDRWAETLRRASFELSVLREVHMQLRMDCCKSDTSGWLSAAPQSRLCSMRGLCILSCGFIVRMGDVSRIDHFSNLYKEPDFSIQSARPCQNSLPFSDHESRLQSYSLGACVHFELITNLRQGFLFQRRCFPSASSCRLDPLVNRGSLLVSSSETYSAPKACRLPSFHQKPLRVRVWIYSRSHSSQHLDLNALIGWFRPFHTVVPAPIPSSIPCPIPAPVLCSSLFPLSFVVDVVCVQPVPCILWDHINSICATIHA